MRYAVFFCGATLTWPRFHLLSLFSSLLACKVGLCVKPCACASCAFEVGKTLYVLAYTLSLKQPSLRFIRDPSLALVAEQGASAAAVLAQRDSQHRTVLSQVRSLFCCYFILFLPIITTKGPESDP